MIPESIERYTRFLQQGNYKAIGLSFLRVGICLWLLKELAINWSSLEIIYGPEGFVVGKRTFLERLPGGVGFTKKYYGWFLGSYAAFIVLYMAGIGRWFTALLVFVMLNILHTMNMSIVNGGDIMARLILFYLVFANSYQYLVLRRDSTSDNDEGRFYNLLSNLAAFSIMLHICAAYFSSGVLKLADPYWRKGEAIYYILQMERFIGTPFNPYINHYPILTVAINYAVILFELLFPMLVWFKKWRYPMLITGVIFHLCLYVFLMIYSFQLVFLLIYLLFLRDQEWQSFTRKFGRRLDGVRIFQTKRKSS